MLPGISSVFMPSATGAGNLDTQTVTVGAIGTSPYRVRGYNTSLSLGKISDGTSNIYSGAAIIDLYWTQDGEDGLGPELVLRIAGTQANSGWTSIIIDGLSAFNRASATFSTSGGNSHWHWTGAGNPFGASGNKLVGFN